MSVIRHRPLFQRHTSTNGRTTLSRNFGTFEKILVLANAKLARQIKGDLEENFFDVHAVSSGGDAIQEIMQNDFAVVVCDTNLQNFPMEMFYTGVERIRPELLSRFIFLVDSDTPEAVIEFIERVDGLKVWRALEMSELCHMLEIVLGQGKPSLPDVA